VFCSVPPGNNLSFKLENYDLFLGSFAGQFFHCFSLLHNTAKILNTDVPPSAIKSINGMRVISITWVILGHTFSNFASQFVGEY
jgi:hypothetical protein